MSECKACGALGGLHKRTCPGPQMGSWGSGPAVSASAVTEGVEVPGGNDEAATDAVDHPPHYTSHPSGIECIQITEHMGFNLGNAIKYVWRADLKNDALEDLRKAEWYIRREIQKREHA